MATIDTEPFELSSVTVAGGQFNAQMPTTGSDRNAIHSMGRSGFTFEITGYVLTQADYDDITSKFMLQEELDLVLRSGGYTYKVFTQEFEPLHNYDTDIVKWPFRVRVKTEDTDIDLGTV